MINLTFAPKFLRQLKKLEPSLRAEVKVKLDSFKNPENHIRLRVHKLHGDLSEYWSFSVNRKIRVVCRFVSDCEVDILAVDGHDIYR